MTLSKFPRQHVALKRPTNTPSLKKKVQALAYKYLHLIHTLSHTSTSTLKALIKEYKNITKPFQPPPLILTKKKKKMNFRKTSSLLIIFVIYVAILSHAGVEASRVLSEDFGNANHLETHSPIYEKTKDIMAYWLQRLPSGPSSGGEGNQLNQVVKGLIQIKKTIIDCFYGFSFLLLFFFLGRDALQPLLHRSISSNVNEKIKFIYSIKFINYQFIFLNFCYILFFLSYIHKNNFISKLRTTNSYYMALI